MINKVISSTPLYVAIHAIRTCWQSFEKGKSVEDDIKLVERIGRKFKHASTLEHIFIYIKVEDDRLIKFFSENPFSRNLGSNYVNVFETNLRVILENKEELIPLFPDLLNQEYSYLLRPDDVEDFEIPEISCNTFKPTKKVTLLHIDKHGSKNFYIKDVSRALLQEIARHRRGAISVKSSRYTLKELKRIEDIIPRKEMILNHIRGIFNKSPKLSQETFDRAEPYLVYTNNKSVDISSVLALHNLQAHIKNGISNDISKYCLPEAYKTEFTWSTNEVNFENFFMLRSSKAALWEIRDLANDLNNSK